jgi:glycosyltransferase involved in cell wall biosynthesis
VPRPITQYVSVPSTDDVRVSVVIPCFNYGHHLTEAVDTVLAQTLQAFEIIIVDDGSTDDSAAVARSLIDAHPEASVRLISQPNSGSPGHSRNVGIAAARAEYIVCLDADDMLALDYLERCAGALDRTPEAAVAYGALQCFGDDHTLTDPREWDTRAELDCNFLTVASMFRRQAWEQVGGIDIEIGYEDWDFWIGCIEHGWVGVKAPGALWYYRVHGGGVYEGHVAKDQQVKAQIVLKHPSVYSDGQRRWAQGVLGGDRVALAAGTQAGAIPDYIAPAPRPAGTERAELPIRSICLITKDYPPNVPGGIPRAVQMQAHMLAASAVEVHVITRSDSGAPMVRHDAGVTVHEVPEPAMAVPPGLGYLEIPVWSYVAAAKFAELDATERFDIVETPDYRGEALHLTPRPETALIVWLHSTMKVVWDIEPDWVPNPHDDAWHSLEMAALQRADLLLAPSQLLMDTTATFLGDRMRPVELMPYLFDSTQFPSQRRPAPDGRVRVLFYGRLEARKNPELALRAVAAARANGHNVSLTMVGRNNGDYTERVLAPLQAELGLHDVTYIPHVDVSSLRQILADSDVAILASRFDNSPLTIFEALSSGVPVITSDRVGTASWIEPENGLLTLAITDPELFGRQAAEAIADAAWMATGPRAAARMREKFAPEVVTEQLLECYGRLMSERGVAPYRLAPRAAPAEPFAPGATTVTETVVSPDQLADSAGALARVTAVAPAQRLDGARAHAVLAFADELVGDPSLLAGWAATFTGADDITLVIYAPGWSTDDAGARLGSVVEAAGLGADDAADLMAVAATATPALEAQLAAGCSAVLTACAPPAPFTALPTVAADAMAGLRAVAIA